MLGGGEVDVKKVLVGWGLFTGPLGAWLGIFSALEIERRPHGASLCMPKHLRRPLDRAPPARRFATVRRPDKLAPTESGQSTVFRRQLELL